MSDINIQNVLSQMKVMASRAHGVETSPATEVGQADFSSLLKKSIEAVNATQKEAGTLSASFVAGDKNVDLAKVMVALQKANVSFQAMTQVRNKLVDAYREVMRMPV